MLYAFMLVSITRACGDGSAIPALGRSASID